MIWKLTSVSIKGCLGLNLALNGIELKILFTCAQNPSFTWNSSLEPQDSKPDVNRLSYHMAVTVYSLIFQARKKLSRLHEVVGRRSEHQDRAMLRRLSRHRLQPENPLRRGSVRARAGTLGPRSRLSGRGHSDGLVQVRTCLKLMPAGFEPMTFSLMPFCQGFTFLWIFLSLQLISCPYWLLVHWWT